MEFGTIRDSALLVLMFIVFGIPAVAISVRIALKPVIDALGRARSLTATRGVDASDPRIAALEADVNRLRSEVQRLAESEAFTRQLIQSDTPSLASRRSRAEE